MSGCASAMDVRGRAAAVFVHRETQHIVSGLQAYARQSQPVKKSPTANRFNYHQQYQYDT
jgi:hypothetical protein